MSDDSPERTTRDDNLSAVAAGRRGQCGPTKTGGQVSAGAAARGKSAKAARKDARGDVFGDVNGDAIPAEHRERTKNTGRN